MSNYQSDRMFTNFVHEHIAIPNIYDPIHWKKVPMDHSRDQRLDMTYGIDYVFEVEGEFKTVQERFRERKYAHYSDFTIRYRRDDHPDASRRHSEFYKMKAQYFTYGILDCDKAEVHAGATFLKYALIDLKMVYKKIDDKQILIVDNKRNRCEKKDGQMLCPVQFNRDRSSSFFPIDIRLLNELWGGETIIIQKGFL